MKKPEIRIKEEKSLFDVDEKEKEQINVTSLS